MAAAVTRFLGRRHGDGPLERTALTDLPSDGRRPGPIVAPYDRSALGGPAGPRPVDPDDLAELARALTVDPAAAADLLGEVAALAGGEQPAGGERTQLLRRFLRRRLPAPRGGAVAQEVDQRRILGTLGYGLSADHPGPGSATNVLVRLAGLTPLARAVWVLRHREGMTLAELAGLLDRPPALVQRTLLAAEQQLAAAPYQVAAALDTLPAVDPARVRAAARRHAVRRRRQRTRLLAGLAAAVLLVAATVLPGLGQRDGVYLRPYGAWVHGFEVAAAPGWRVGGRTLTPERDSLTVYRDDDPRRSCLVDVLTTREPLTVPDGEQVRVQGRRATLVPTGGGSSPYLWWSLGPRSAAVIGCSDSVGDRTLLDLGRLVRLRAVPLGLPFDLSDLGQGAYGGPEVRFVSVRDQATVALSLPAGEVSRTSTTVYVSVPGTSRVAEDRQRRSAVVVQGRSGTLDRGRNGGVAVCWPVQASNACVSAYVFREAVDPEQNRLRQRLQGMAERVGFAADTSDPGTWLDARQALPG